MKLNIKIMLDALGTPELSETWIRDTLKQRLMSTRRKRQELEELELKASGLDPTDPNLSQVEILRRHEKSLRLQVEN